MTKLQILYVTSSTYKAEENRLFVERCKLADGTPVHDMFAFEIVQVPITEILSEDLRVMVTDEVAKAYHQLRTPCIVEHAGLIFDDYAKVSYPGGLTKPMWNVLGANFIQETNSAGRGAIARAVVAYCDGISVHTFDGETHGVLADAPRGHRDFYWDTIFIPDDPSGRTADKTYAEIVEDTSLGLPYKVEQLSQSSKAMIKFLEHLRITGPSALWPNTAFVL